jgi:hypothetical protein
MRPWLFAPLILLLSGCPKASDEGGQCAEDSDCSSGQTCLYDQNLSTTYCTGSCVRDLDCAANRFCSTGFDSKESGSAETALCVERVRSCDSAELCNGLDDDCDGVIDGPSCTPITGCLNDAVCGAFYCQAPSGRSEAVCLAPNSSAALRFGDTCTSGVECPNGDCSSGQCLPFCQAGNLVDCSGPDEYCAIAAGPRDQPIHNACMQLCDNPGDCTAPQVCLWRSAYFGPGASRNGTVYVPVCSLPGPERLPLGAACSGNDLEGDDECAYGLCFGNVCTQLCSGAGSDCGAVGPEFVCLSTVLRYIPNVFEEFICARPE